MEIKRSKQWCSAGQIACNHFKFCNCWGHGYGTSIDDFEQCPWPSRQVLIKTEPNCETVAAEIADMPIEEFKDNLKSLKQLSGRKELNFANERDNKYFMKGCARGGEKMKAEILDVVESCHWYDQKLHDDCIEAIKKVEVI